MVIGWIDADGKEHFHDRYAKGRQQPTIDQNQDYQLLEMKEENGFTSYTFKRKLVLPDPDDFTITGDTVRVLWAWNDDDPLDDESAMYHQTNRGILIVVFDKGFKDDNQTFRPCDIKTIYNWMEQQSIVQTVNIHPPSARHLRAES